MSASDQNAIRVSTIGMNRQSINALRLFFRGPCMDKYVLSDESIADVCIVDIDAYNANLAWEKYRKKYPQRPTILKSINETNINSVVFVRKPVNGETLNKALTKLTSQLQSASMIPAEVKYIEPFVGQFAEQYAEEPKNIKSIETVTQATLASGNKQYKKKHSEKKHVKALLPTDFLSTTESSPQLYSVNLAVNRLMQVTKRKTPKLKQKKSVNAVTKEKVTEITEITEEKKEIWRKWLDHTSAKENEAYSKITPDGGITHVRGEVTNDVPQITSVPIQAKFTDDASNMGSNNTSVIKNSNSIFYNPDDYLQGYLKKSFKLALEENKNILLEGLLQSIIVLPETLEVFVKRSGNSSQVMSERSIFAISGVPLTDKNMKITILSESYEKICKQDGLLFEYELLVWKLAVRASRGRMPKMTDVNKEMYLGQWPNIPSLKLTPNALKIAALWVEKPCTLSMTATSLNLPPSEVFTFLSAASALELVDCSHSSQECGGVIDSTDYQRKENLLGKLFSKMCALPGIKNNNKNIY